jgi:uncharacterized protein
MKSLPLKLKHKETALIDVLKNYNALLIAFSGGLDSSLLLYVAANVLGTANVLAVTAKAPFFTTLETQYIKPLIHNIKVGHSYVDHQGLSCKKFTQNFPDRCYQCKKIIFSLLTAIADKNNINHIAHGENTDDLKTYRPGTKAAKEYSIISPLIEAHLTRHDIQMLARYYHLSNWNLSQMACLATRIPYYDEITLEKLQMIGQAENVLIQMGFPGARVRWIDWTAKIEIPTNQLASFFHRQLQGDIIHHFKNIGFKNIMIDPDGYRSGFDDARFRNHQY